tara:strand:+ start:1240 stop:2064 length:825 start_codon:yes stop_codon:yes gene_type:complete
MFSQIKIVLKRCQMGCQQAYSAVLLWLLLGTFLISGNPHVMIIFIMTFANAAQSIQPSRDWISDLFMGVSIGIALYILFRQVTVIPTIPITEQLKTWYHYPRDILALDSTLYFIALSFYPLVSQIKPRQKAKLAQASLILVTCLYAVFAAGLLVAGTLLTQSIQFKFAYPPMITVWLVNTLMTSLSEEVFYRGIIQNMLNRFMPKKEILVIILTALIYGLSNFRLGFEIMVLTSLCGVFYSFLYRATKELRYPVILHAFLNTIYFIFFDVPVLS